MECPCFSTIQVFESIYSFGGSNIQSSNPSHHPSLSKKWALTSVSLKQNVLYSIGSNLKAFSKASTVCFYLRENLDLLGYSQAAAQKGTNAPSTTLSPPFFCQSFPILIFSLSKDQMLHCSISGRNGLRTCLLDRQKGKAFFKQRNFYRDFTKASLKVGIKLLLTFKEFLSLFLPVQIHLPKKRFSGKLNLYLLGSQRGLQPRHSRTWGKVNSLDLSCFLLRMSPFPRVSVWSFVGVFLH